MQSEVSIAKPLSGPECVEACLDAIRKTLAKDDRFNTHVAYPGFRAVIDLHFYPFNSYMLPVERSVEVSEGDVSGEEMDRITASVELPVRPPNQVREEADMPQPVLITDQTGQAREEWKKTGKIPRNIIKGR